MLRGTGAKGRPHSRGGGGLTAAGGGGLIAAQTKPGERNQENDHHRPPAGEPAAKPPKVVAVAVLKDWEKTADQLAINPFVLGAAVIAHGEERVREVVMECARRFQKGKIESPEGWCKRALEGNWNLKRPSMKPQPARMQAAKALHGDGRTDYMTRENRATWESLDETARAQWLTLFKSTHTNPYYAAFIKNAEAGNPNNTYVEWIRDQRKKGIQP